MPYTPVFQTADQPSFPSLVVEGTLSAGYGRFGELSSSDYIPASRGWILPGDGNAEFNNVTVRGTIYATAGEIGGLTITGTLTLDGGTIYNKVTNPRVAFDTNGFNILNGSGASVGSLTFNTTTGSAYFGSSLEVGGVLTAGSFTSIGDTGIKFGSNISAAFAGTIVGNHETGAPQSVVNGGQIRISVGGASPSKLAQYGFYDGTAGPNAGLGYITSTDEVILVQNNLARVTVGATYIRVPDGSSSVPGIAFASNPTTGIYKVGTDRLGVSVGSTHVAEFNAQKFRSAVLNSGSPELNMGGLTPSATQPSYGFQGDANTGYYWVSADISAISGGGAIVMVFDNPNTDIRPGVDNNYNLGNASFRFVDVWAVDTTINSSDRRSKTAIRKLAFDPVEMVREVPIRQFRRHRRKRTHISWIAQDVAAWLDGRGIDYAMLIDPSRVGEEGEMGLRIGELTAVLWAACQEYDRRLMALEGA